MRQLYFERDNMVFVQLTYVPSLSPGEQKTKPTQQASRLLQSQGIQPHIILTREQEKLTEESRKKISLYCNVPEEAVFDDPLLSTVYELPLVLEKQGFYRQLAKRLGLPEGKEADLKEWHRRVERIISPKGKPLRIAIVGKYTAVKDAYISVREALVHGAAAVDCGLEISWIEASDLEKVYDVAEVLSPYDGILVPGGFGERGIEGKISAIKYAREAKVPYLGLCLGLQLMVVEYARDVCGLKDANSTEFNKKTPHPVVDILPEQLKITKMGATMRLGAYPCTVKKGTIAYRAYGAEKVSERHRHRYEVNPNYVETLEKGGLVISGRHDSGIVEIAEWKDSFGIATQPHIELRSRLEAPAPIFVEFMKAAKEYRDVPRKSAGEEIAD